jgi:hypothetical protein
MNTITAINPKNQSLVNKATAWLVKYNKANDQRNDADADLNNIGGTHKIYDKYDRLCEKTFDKFLEYMDELPKGQQKAIYNSELY